MIEENQQLVTDEPVAVRDFKIITGHFRVIYGIYLKLKHKKPKDVNM